MVIGSLSAVLSFGVHINASSKYVELEGFFVITRQLDATVCFCAAHCDFEICESRSCGIDADCK